MKTIITIGHYDEEVGMINEVKANELFLQDKAGTFFVSFYILIWLVKTILLYLSAERGLKKTKRNPSTRYNKS